MMQEPTSFNLGQEHMALHKPKKVMLSSLAIHFISKSSKVGRIRAAGAGEAGAAKAAPSFVSHVSTKN